MLGRLIRDKLAAGAGLMAWLLGAKTPTAAWAWATAAWATVAQGEAWASALSSLPAAAGLAPFSVHRDALVRTRWSTDACFAGVGPGEVLVADGRKAVGLAQRRTRGGALFQCAALLSWDPGPLVDGLDGAHQDILDLGSSLGFRDSPHHDNASPTQ